MTFAGWISSGGKVRGTITEQAEKEDTDEARLQGYEQLRQMIAVYPAMIQCASAGKFLALADQLLLLCGRDAAGRISEDVE